MAHCVKTVLALSRTPCAASKRSKNRLGTGNFSVTVHAAEHGSVPNKAKLAVMTLRASPLRRALAACGALQDSSRRV